MRTCLFALLLVTGIPAANAMPVRFDFTVSLRADPGIETGTLPGSGTADGFGYVVFDNDLFALADGTGTVGDYNNPLPTIDLSFDWLGLHWDETNAALGVLNLDSLGNLNFWSIDAVVPANSCTRNFLCVQWATTDFNVLVSGNFGTALLTQQGVSGVAIGNVSAVSTPVEVPVPEPGTFGIMALGLAGVWLLRRKSAPI
jgi:hypothetical protein